MKWCEEWLISLNHNKYSVLYIGGIAMAAADDQVDLAITIKQIKLVWRYIFKNQES